jgi:hypothetical protein
MAPLATTPLNRSFSDCRYSSHLSIITCHPIPSASVLSYNGSGNHSMHCGGVNDTHPVDYPIAAITSWHASCFSPRTPSSKVTPSPLENVIRQRARIFPPPPVNKPASCSVWTDVPAAGFWDPPRGSILSISTIESHAADSACKCHRERVERIML